jgi:hypothetical protein
MDDMTVNQILKCSNNKTLKHADELRRYLNNEDLFDLFNTNSVYIHNAYLSATFDWVVEKYGHCASLLKERDALFQQIMKFLQVMNNRFGLAIVSTKLNTNKLEKLFKTSTQKQTLVIGQLNRSSYCGIYRAVSGVSFDYFLKASINNHICDPMFNMSNMSSYLKRLIMIQVKQKENNSTSTHQTFIAVSS